HELPLSQTDLKINQAYRVFCRYTTWGSRRVAVFMRQKSPTQSTRPALAQKGRRYCGFFDFAASYQESDQTRRRGINSQFPSRVSSRPFCEKGKGRRDAVKRLCHLGDRNRAARLRPWTDADSSLHLELSQQATPSAAVSGVPPAPILSRSAWLRANRLPTGSPS